MAHDAGKWGKSNMCCFTDCHIIGICNVTSTSFQVILSNTKGYYIDTNINTFNVCFKVCILQSMRTSKCAYLNKCFEIRMIWVTAFIVFDEVCWVISSSKWAGTLPWIHWCIKRANIQMNSDEQWLQWPHRWAGQLNEESMTNEWNTD